MRRIAIMIASIAVFLGTSAAAQAARSEIGLHGTGFFTTDTTGQGTTQRCTNTGGFLVGYRYAGWQQKASTVTTGTLKSILLLPDSREFRPILIRRPEALSSAYRRPRGSDSAPISSQKEARSSSILRATRLRQRRSCATSGYRCVCLRRWCRFSTFQACRLARRISWSGVPRTELWSGNAQYQCNHSYSGTVSGNRIPVLSVAMLEMRI